MKVIGTIIGIFIAGIVLYALSSAVLIGADSTFGRLPFADPEQSWAIMGFILGAGFYLALVASAQLRSEAIRYAGLIVLFLFVLAAFEAGRNRAAVMREVRRSETMGLAREKAGQANKFFQDAARKSAETRDAKSDYKAEQRAASALFKKLTAMFNDVERKTLLEPVMLLMEKGELKNGNADAYRRGESLYREAKTELITLDRSYQAAINDHHRYTKRIHEIRNDIPDLKVYAGDKWAAVQTHLSDAEECTVRMEAAPHYRAALLVLEDAVSHLEAARNAHREYSAAQADAKALYEKISASLDAKDRSVLTAILQLMDHGEQLYGDVESWQNGLARYREAEAKLMKVERACLAALALRRRYEDQAEAFRGEITELEKYAGGKWAEVQAHIAQAESSSSLFESAPHYRAAEHALDDAVRAMDNARRKDIGKR